MRSTRSKTSALRCETGTPVAAGSYHKARVLPPGSADLHVGQRPIRTQPKRVLSVREKKKGKRIHKKEFPENVVAGRLVVCNRRAARQAQVVARLVPRLQLDHTTRHTSCHLLLLIRMSVNAQSATTETRSLCARKEKRKKISQKRIPRECCCWPTCRLQSTRSTTSADRYVAGIPVTTRPYHKAQVLPPASADLHVARRAIHTKRNAFALCEKEKR